MNEAFLRRLFSKVECSVCGKRYDSSNIKVLDHEEDLWFLSVTCASCGTQGLVAAVVKEGSVVAEPISDLTEAEYSTLAGREEVGVDDVLDMHSFLKEFNGDFVALFSGR